MVPQQSSTAHRPRVLMVSACPSLQSKQPLYSIYNGVACFAEKRDLSSKNDCEKKHTGMFLNRIKVRDHALRNCFVQGSQAMTCPLRLTTKPFMRVSQQRCDVFRVCAREHEGCSIRTSNT
jgi:hypothetical protein